MVGWAESNSHGIATLNYVSGRAKSKEGHEEKIFRLRDHLMPPGMEPTSMWMYMKHRATGCERSVIQFTLSPEAKHTEGWKDEDWLKLWDEFVAEFDAIELRRHGDGKIFSKKTNIANSAYTLWRHEDSEGGIPHLHCVACRKDQNGRTNNSHEILTRAQTAADTVAIRRGWLTPKQIRERNIQDAVDCCMRIIKRMPEWNLQQYFHELERSGYEVYARPDSNGEIHGYSLIRGNASYKASELGKGRHLLIKNLKETWEKAHPAPKQRKPTEDKPIRKPQPTIKPTQQTPKPENKPVVAPKPKWPDYTQPSKGTIPYLFSFDGNDYTRHIPENVVDFWKEEFDENRYSNSESLMHTAAAVFVGLLLPPTAPVSSGGGGGCNNEDWGRKKDDDDWKWANKCARYAIARLGKTPRIKMRR